MKFRKLFENASASYILSDLFSALFSVKNVQSGKTESIPRIFVNLIVTGNVKYTFFVQN